MEKFYLMTIVDQNIYFTGGGNSLPQKIWRLALVQGADNAKDYMKTGSRCFVFDGFKEIKEIKADYTDVLKEEEPKAIDS